MSFRLPMSSTIGICVCARLILAMASIWVILISSGNCASRTSQQPPPPNCSIQLYEEGTNKLSHNITEIEPGTFVVRLNATKPSMERWSTADTAYFTSLFVGEDGTPPPHVLITCTSSSYAIEFEFEGVGSLDFLTMGRRYATIPEVECKLMDDPKCTAVYTTYVLALLLPQATGKYIFYSIFDKDVSTSYFIFAESKSKPFLIGASSSNSHVLTPKLTVGTDNATTAILPCVTSNYNVTVNLFKQLTFPPGRPAWLKLQQQEVRFDPKQGFIGTLKPGHDSDLMVTETGTATDLGSGIYKCTTGDAFDPDFVLVDLRPETPTKSEGQSELTLFFIDHTAICRSSSNTSGEIRMSNMDSRNPTETRLLAECMKKGNSFCGSHSYHSRKEADGLMLGTADNCHQPTCAQIQGVHQDGLVYCSQGARNAMKEYFTGMDGLTYTDWKSAPQHALLRPHIFTYNNEVKVGDNFTHQVTIQEEGRTSTIYGPFHFRTGSYYRMHCEPVRLLTTEPITIKIKYYNGSVTHWADLSWGIARVEYLTPDMTEISCSARLWTTNDAVTTTIRIVVEEVDCDPGHFKCESNRQCIEEEDVCDGHQRCADGSDEKESTCQKFRPKLLRGPVEFTFVPHSRNYLACELSGEFPHRLRPLLEWHHNGQNITDKKRVWQSSDGQSLLLRFLDVSIADEGEYTCVATTQYGSDSYKSRVKVRGTDVRVPTTPKATQAPTQITTSSSKPMENVPTNSGVVPVAHVHAPQHFQKEPEPVPEKWGDDSAALTAGVILVGAAFKAWNHYNGISLRLPRFASFGRFGETRVRAPSKCDRRKRADNVII